MTYRVKEKDALGQASLVLSEALKRKLCPLNDPHMRPGLHSTPKQSITSPQATLECYIIGKDGGLGLKQRSLLVSISTTVPNDRL